MRIRTEGSLCGMCLVLRDWLVVITTVGGLIWYAW